MDTEVDRISDLHESVVGEILSLLPTKEALRTCILSKAWKDNWTAIKDVNVGFSDWDYDSNKFIRNFLQAVGGSQLRRFQYKSYVGESSNREFKDLLTVFRRNLEELRLSVRATVELSPSYPLSKLRILDLECIKIVSHESSRFVLHCPLLKSLTFAWCDWMDFTRITIDSPNLDTLHIEDCSYVNETSDHAFESGYCVFNVMAPHLNEFIYSGAFHEEFTLSNPSSVSRAIINITTWTGQNPWRYDCRDKFLASLSNLKR